MPEVIINGKKYHYAAGIPQSQAEHVIILVHGAGGNHRHWAYQTTHLGKKYLAIAVDLPGHGGSEGSSCDKIEEYADFIYDFAAHVTGTKFFLAGHSMGGAIALDFALRYPQQLHGLVLVGTGARLRVAQPILDTFASGNRFYQLLEFAYGSAASTELLDLARKEMDNTDPIVYYNDFTACDKFDVMDRLQEINLPTLVLAAGEDRLTPVKYSEFLAANISNARLEIIKQAGHMLMLEKPEEVNSAIERFISAYSN